MSADIRVFQIFYDEATRASLDRDFEPIDNSKSERSDWYEYWPIRAYLSQNPLDESVFYGFLSPRFFDKTGLRGAQVKDFVRRAGDVDVVTFSPFPCHGACFLNVFDHGEFFHRGFAGVATRFFESVNPRVKLDTLVMNSRNTVFANFSLAKREFWRSWMAIFDRLFELAETPGSPLHASLNEKAEYMKDGGEKTFTHMKIFVMERAVSYLLAGSAEFRVANFPPFQAPLCQSFTGRLADVVILDALKIAFSETNDPHFLQLFKQIRELVIATTWLKDVGPKRAGATG
jgi:hypothetical protein